MFVFYTPAAKSKVILSDAWLALATYHRPSCDHCDPRVGWPPWRARLVHYTVARFVDWSLPRSRNFAGELFHKNCRQQNRGFQNNFASFASAISPRDELSRAVKTFPSPLTTHHVLANNGLTCGVISHAAGFRALEFSENFRRCPTNIALKKALKLFFKEHLENVFRQIISLFYTRDRLPKSELLWRNGAFGS